MRRFRVACRRIALSLLLGGSILVSVANAQPPTTLSARIGRLIDQPPFDRATWAVIVGDSAGRVLYERNADRLMVPASNNKLLITCAALNLLGPTHRVTTSIYGDGPVEDGVLRGDLIAYGRGDPTYSSRCYDGGCDSLWTGLDALADELIAHGLRRVEGAIVGDGSYF